jgi:hypothetical protein
MRYYCYPPLLHFRPWIRRLIFVFFGYDLYHHRFVFCGACGFVLMISLGRCLCFCTCIRLDSVHRMFVARNTDC